MSSSHETLPKSVTLNLAGPGGGPIMLVPVPDSTTDARQDSKSLLRRPGTNSTSVDKAVMSKKSWGSVSNPVLAQALSKPPMLVAQPVPDCLPQNKTGNNVLDSKESILSI